MPDLRLLFTAVALVAAMLASGVIGWRSRIGAVQLALLSLVWLTVDRLWEGAKLVTISRNHTLVLSDLVGLAGLAASVALWVRISHLARDEAPTPVEYPANER